MKVTAIAPWFGGKRTMAPLIVEQLGSHSSYWEPFCGSCAVLFAKKPSRQETVCDLHGELINLAKVLADPVAAPKLYEECSRVLYHTKLYELYREHLERGHYTNMVYRAAAFMVLSWMGRNGTSGTEQTNYAPSIRFTSGGGSSPTRWRSAVESIPFWHERLRNVCILHHDAFDVIPKIEDDREAAIYADPPYLLDTRGQGGGSRYLHDFSEASSPLFGEGDDHERLAKQLKRFRRARVVVSYYDHPRVRELYKDWTVIECSRQKNLRVQNRRGTGRCVAPEVLIVNGPMIDKTRLGGGNTAEVVARFTLHSATLRASTVHGFQGDERRPLTQDGIFFRASNEAPKRGSVILIRYSSPSSGKRNRRGP